jgi:two-component system OmpR family sensor kinase
MTLRQRLTLWYTLALAATVFVFGAVLYVDRRISAERESLREVDGRLRLTATLAAGWLAESRRVLDRVISYPDTLPALDPAIANYFEPIRDYLVVLSPDGRPLYLSEAVRSLRPEAVLMLLQAARGPPWRPGSGDLALDPLGAPARYVLQPVPEAADQIGAILVAALPGPVAFGPEALLRSMAAVLPVLLLSAIVLGFWLSGQVYRPLEPMIAELQAITDGRSLHRRLPVPAESAELAGLATAVNRMFARLEQSFAALYRFIADASHELKTPLMVLRAGVERALTNPGNPPENLESLDASLAEINRMSEMVDNLLTLARADEGRAPLVVEPCDLRDLVAEAAETAGMLAEDGRHRVTTMMPPEPVVLPVERDRIRQLLLNLVTNAVKYTPAGGEVGLELEDRGEDVVIRVRDTGIGIAAGDLPHVFDRFWRADAARSRAGQAPGAGLGLAITKWVAEAHGGAIAVQSRPGRGTTFTVTLPRGPEPGDVADI